MNKPVTFICVGVAGIGLAILARSTFLAITYGSMEAGNFNRCHYSTTRDSQTGRLVREWDSIPESTEDSLMQRLDMWFVGLAFVAVGAGVFVLEHTARTKCP